jgi:hypothetical protein
MGVASRAGDVRLGDVPVLATHRFCLRDRADVWICYTFWTSTTGSAVLETDLWLLVDPSFLPPDGDPVFFEGELAFLAKKSVEEMKEIVKVKCAFPRCRVVQ